MGSSRSPPAQKRRPRRHRRHAPASTYRTGCACTGARCHGYHTPPPTTVPGCTCMERRKILCILFNVKLSLTTNLVSEIQKENVNKHFRNGVLTNFTEFIVKFTKLLQVKCSTVVPGEVDCDDVSAAYGDAVAWIQRKSTVTDPQRHGHRLADKLQYM